jgi:outer membrane protein TolC
VRDERLRQVVNRALAQNRDLRVAVLNVERSRAQLRITDADRWPSLSVGLTGQRAPNSSGNETNTFTGGLQLASYELDLFGRLRNNSDAASATLLSNVAAARSARLSLVTATATAWLTLAADEEQLRLAQRTLATRDETLRLVRLQADVGAASELDLRGVQPSRPRPAPRWPSCSASAMPT